MRLTLRTLLAWLDDTLPPSEVREIGKQVAESPFAKELVERIHRVTRQRRLTIPPWSGPDSADSNLVASYLDNELDPDQVAEFERKCLTSDVHLAEVASVHQILSLVGQKAKVPIEARLRMYGLIKGREAIRPKAHAGNHEDEAEPVTEPIQPWVPPIPPQRPWWERYGPTAAVVGMILLLGWSAWRTLSPPEVASRELGPPGAPARNAPGAGGTGGEAPAKKGEGAGPVAAPQPVADATGSAPKGAEAVTAKEPEKVADKGQEKAGKPGSDIPPGSAGFVKKPDGLLLRYNSSPDRRDWDRIVDATPLQEQDRLLSLAPFRANVEVGRANVDLVGETEVWVRATPGTQAARLSLSQGRLVLHGTTPPLPFEVQFTGKAVTLTPPSGAAVGVERRTRRAPGEPTASGAALVVFATDGPVTVASGGDEETVSGPGAVSVAADGKRTALPPQPTPAWVTETALPPFDQKVGEQFLQYFRPDRPIVSSLVEASEDDKRDVCRLAIGALKAVGDISYIVPLLNRRGNPTAPTARRAAISVLRAYLAEGADAVKALRQQLQRDLGNEQAAIVEKLLVGYTAKEGVEEATYSKLVQYLGTTDQEEVGVRELALDNLQQLTGRDDLGYDPENPTANGGKGLKAWRDLLRDHELKPAAARGDVK
jgi:hypothetical protein